MSEREPFVDQYIKEIGVNWKVNYVYGDVDSPIITSSKENREHYLAFPWIHASFSGIFRCDFVNLLVKAKFAETLDPIFSTVNFHPRHSIGNRTFQKRAEMLFCSQHFINIWAADKMKKIDKKFTEEDTLIRLDALLSSSSENFSRLKSESVVEYSLICGQIKRFKLYQFETENKETLIKAQSLFDRDLTLLARMYATIPALPQDKKKALSLLEKKSRQAAKILEFPIKPTLVFLDGKYFWDFV